MASRSSAHSRAYSKHKRYTYTAIGSEKEIQIESRKHEHTFHVDLTPYRMLPLPPRSCYTAQSLVTVVILHIGRVSSER